MKTQIVRSGGIGFMGLLALLFIACKILGHLSWPWYWILAPLWGPLAVAFGSFVFAFVVYVTVAVLKHRRRK